VDELVAEVLHEEADVMIDAWMDTTESGGRVGRVADEPPPHCWGDELTEDEIHAASRETAADGLGI
jgi:hypothetical protein